MFKDAEDIERSWRSLKVETSSYCNILDAMMTKVCDCLCEMFERDWSAAQGTQKVTLPSDWTAALSLPWVWLPHWNKTRCNPIGFMLGFDTCVRAWYLLWIWTRRGAIQCGPPSHTQLVWSGPSTPPSPGSVLLKWHQFPAYWSPVNDTQRHLQTIL